MKMLFAAIIATGLAFAPAAFAQDAMKPAMKDTKMDKMDKKTDAMAKPADKMEKSGGTMDKKDSMSKDGMAKDGMKDGMKK